MTKEQKIEALSNEIRKALPYLKQAEEPVKLFSISNNGNSIQSMQISNLICIQLEPMLNDVLVWLRLIKEKRAYFVSFFGRFYDIKIDEIGVSWNLEKPYLKDQSEELINFLYSLIEQK